MPTPRFVVWMLSMGVMVLGGGMASSQNFPTKIVRIVAATPAGGADFIARVIAGELTGGLGQPVIIDNRGPTAPEIVVGAAPDGYTLLFYGSSVWLVPLMKKTSYDPVRDFSPITLVATTPNILVVHPSLPVKSVKELIALAKARPGELNYATGSVGSQTHLPAELLKSMAGVNIVHVPYRGAGPALQALLGGEVQMWFPTTASAAPYLKSGRMRALAVTSAQPSALAPGLPTMAAAGLPGYESATTYGLLAPANTPAAIINRLNQETVRVLNRADVKEKFLISGVESIGTSPEDFAARMKSEMALIGKLVRDADIRIE